MSRLPTLIFKKNDTSHRGKSIPSCHKSKDDNFAGVKYTSRWKKNK